MSKPASTTSQPKYKCSWEQCKKVFKHLHHLQNHYRTHTNEKPYSCTFRNCDHTSSSLRHIYKHIRNVHKRQHSTVENYVKVNKEVLDTEEKLFGIKKYIYSKVNTDGDNDKHATVKQPTLPPFTTIYRTSTGHYICPLNKCDQQCNDFAELKKHYRVHCGNDFRVYRCSITDSCRYAANLKKNVVKHIRAKHASHLAANKNGNNTSIDDGKLNGYSDFIHTNTDLLEMVNALFKSAQIVSPPEMEVHRPLIYACPFSNCSKEFSHISHFRNHRRTHTQTKPFFCSFSDCHFETNRKSTLLSHVHSFHFNVLSKNQKKLSNDKKLRAEQYVGVKHDLLNEENAQIALARIEPKDKLNKQQCSFDEHSISKNDSTNFSDDPVHNDTTEDEYDDKDELISLLATIRSATFSN